MRAAFLVFTFYLLTSSLFAQGNLHPVLPQNISFKVKLADAVSESSGLLYTKGNLWTLNDSGGLPAIYCIDTLTGLIRQIVFIDNFPNVDWEDLTADDEFIYIGDFGNNKGMRTDLRILKIPLSAIDNSPVVHLKAEAIRFSYADQINFQKNPGNNFDCEAILSIDNSLYVFSKDRGDAQTRVYAISKTPGTYVVKPCTTFDVKGRICGAAYNVETKEIALIGYLGTKAGAFIWLLNGYKGDQFFSGTKKRIEIGNNVLKWKTEGITYRDNNRFFISCETLGTIPAGLYSFYKN